MQGTLCFMLWLPLPLFKAKQNGTEVSLLVLIQEVKCSNLGGATTVSLRDSRIQANGIHIFK
jgi:hypothetical protein